METSKKILVTRIYTSAERTNFERGKWWNTVLSNQNVVIGILWTLDALVDALDSGGDSTWPSVDGQAV
ncbi:hypothetical protein POSPLADRAFT_1062843 [Postia placenta MAD-698-R-SB12]|uniref:Uncharacterized protein n=1 Tax=Postia placenta MAD-698-R-SB12 TaxID=670580 RepID=A0A1X6MJ54_9APHY|nr:hypothetical protein POSPLADRAFT_1062843 [Postia placenta MAD-698-R-SB12]OSX56349.1 hypothetical protein POSPLADRAFT_1062843 [Postia placenta MAD-698-R-SB12]